MALELSEFDKVFLANQDLNELDDQMTKDMRRGMRPPRKYLKILGQGNSTTRPIIPEASPDDPNGGVWWRFIPIRHPEEAPAPQLSKPLGAYYFGAYIHWLKVLNGEGREVPLRTVCCGDYRKMEGMKVPLDTPNCPSCAYTEDWIAEHGLQEVDRMTPGIPGYRRYWLGFNETAYDTDLQEWLEEGKVENQVRDGALFEPPLWLLEVGSGPLFEQIAMQNMNKEWGRITNYRVRLYKTMGKRGGGQWEYKLAPVVKDIMNEHQFRPFTPAQHRSIAKYNHGVDQEGALVAVPDIAYDVYPWEADEHKRRIYGGQERAAQREAHSTAKFADNPVRLAEARAHAPTPFVPDAAPPPSPVRAGRMPGAANTEVPF